ncbi:guanine deaminase [Hahella sp. CCB-MM4]|uniref:guanine deaminase n=1 Tax=Hahella sp. (strain CCB-MM4) TaxID=1926491 RepID=UPI000B9B1819|nr:guanine deaminase [Hahella sp. CCB-MM4]OZG70264.1 guanine deaminase [Hahella sp. CCB-MM4]
MSLTVLRGEILSFMDDPDKSGEQGYVHFHDGILVVEGDKIKAVGPAEDLLSSVSADTVVLEYQNKLIMPGFIDTHIHYPQVDVLASYGEQLLEWLNNYTFPTERQFSDPQHARETADFFLDELIKAGTTTALVFGTVHPQSVEAFFEASELRNTRMICGKVMMDRHAPDFLCDTAEASYQDSKALIEQWHGRGRQLYAVTPRFAITSSDEQLQKAGQLLKEYPGVFMQTHLSENTDEVDFVQKLFPGACDYLDVYDQNGLLSGRSVFAHGIHLCEREHARLRETESSISFCPTSNLFLGSGLLDLAQLEKEQVTYSMGTDVGGGTSFSMLQTLNEAYKVAQMRQYKLSPLKAFYLATLGGARALKLDHLIGSLQPEREADFIVLDYAATPLIKRRLSKCKNLEERLFALMILGDDRSVAETWVAGQCLYQRSQND